MRDDFRLCGKLILPDRVMPGCVTVHDGRIAAIDSDDGGEGFISPGFIDLHVHGGDGADYMDGTGEAVRRANRAHLRHGTTSIFPTTTTGSPQQVLRMIHACKEVCEGWSIADGARIAGVHLYGPYFAEDKVGCHSVGGRRDPERAEYDELLALDIVRIATCAAELPGAEEFYRAARARCLVTCGHSNANWTEMARAFEAGVRHVDHFWCAMSSVSSLRQRFGTPMQASMEQFVLANAEMSTEVIADGQHLSPELLEFAYRMKGPSRLCLVTDANRALDMPPGRYRFGCIEDGSWFESNGKVGIADGALASSIVGLDTMVRVMKRDTSATLAEVVRMASLTPAERVGISAETGSIEIGKRADLLVLSEEVEVRRVFIDGEESAIPQPKFLGSQNIWIHCCFDADMARDEVRAYSDCVYGLVFSGNSCIINIQGMNGSVSRAELSSAERSLRSRIARLASSERFLRGSLSERTTRCGKPTCHCVEGEGHRSLYLVQSHAGKVRQICVPKAWQDPVRQAVGVYQEIRGLMDEVSALEWKRFQSRKR